MNPRMSLALAVAAGVLAVAIVSVDLVYTLTASLDSMSGGSWQTVQKAPSDSQTKYAIQPNCGSQHMRVVVDNHKPLPDRVRVLVTYNGGPESQRSPLVDETWSLKAFESREREFDIPSSAFSSSSTPKPYVSVNVQVGDLFLNSCVDQGTGA